MICRWRTNRAFTLIELTVAVAALVVILSIVGVVFRVSIEAHRTAVANAEIMLKLRAITDQLNRDFRGLRKDGEIFVTWVARPLEDSNGELIRHIRFDRIMFFADGDFYTYHHNPVIRGNLARISYMLAKKGDVHAQAQIPPSERVLVRSQHILTANPDPALVDFPSRFDTFPMPEDFLNWVEDWHNTYEYDKITLAKWNSMRWGPPPVTNYGKAHLLSAITDVRMAELPDIYLKGSRLYLDPNDPKRIDPDSMHMILCEGVGEFKIQGWHERLQRWIPMVDPDADGYFLPDSDLIFYEEGKTEIDEGRVPGVLYPGTANGHGISVGGAFAAAVATGDPNDPHYYEQSWNSKTHFHKIPGLGRALKFTFTLYDSKGIFKEGRTFTHIIYLED